MVTNVDTPKFWYRPVSDGEMYEGPVHHNSVGGKMLRDEKPSEWIPLYALPNLSHPGWAVVPMGDLYELQCSINGDCYMGQEWERKCVDALVEHAKQGPIESSELVAYEVTVPGKPGRGRALVFEDEHQKFPQSYQRRPLFSAPYRAPISSHQAVRAFLELPAVPDRYSDAFIEGVRYAERIHGVVMHQKKETP